MHSEVLSPPSDYLLNFDDGVRLKRPLARPATTLTVVLHSPVEVRLEHVRLLSSSAPGLEQVSSTYGRQAVSTFIRLLQTGWEGYHRLYLADGLHLSLASTKAYRYLEGSSVPLDTTQTTHALGFVEAALPLFGWVDPAYESDPPGVAAFDRERGCWYPPGPNPPTRP